jgi:SAM-dependent methyltransferase
MAINQYDDEESLRLNVARVGARSLIGGLWDRVGQLQADYLIDRGLLPRHRFLDLGCGCLRAGVKLVPWLEPGNYFGIDISPTLLDEGRKELTQLGLSGRVPTYNLRATGDFDIDGFPPFDFGIAQSVFTHLPLVLLETCLRRIRPNFEDGGSFFATFFIGPPNVSGFLQNCGKPTHSDRDPFHFSVSDISSSAEAAGWQTRWIGEWGHPRDQQLAEFRVAS